MIIWSFDRMSFVNSAEHASSQFSTWIHVAKIRPLTWISGFKDTKYKNSPILSWPYLCWKPFACITLDIIFLNEFNSLELNVSILIQLKAQDPSVSQINNNINSVYLFDIWGEISTWAFINMLAYYCFHLWVNAAGCKFKTAYHHDYDCDFKIRTWGIRWPWAGEIIDKMYVFYMSVSVSIPGRSAKCWWRDQLPQLCQLPNFSNIKHNPGSTYLTWKAQSLVIFSRSMTKCVRVPGECARVLSTHTNTPHSANNHRGARRV